MSDVSALSHDYEATAQFAERINSAVLSLKKALRHGPRALAPNETGTLADVVQAVRTQLGQRLTPTTPSVPQEVIERLTSEHKAQMGYFLDDLAGAEKALRGNSPVDAEVIRVLDDICDAADASASAMFRRLRRR
jgi:ABC-type transporter Mla subunit MlaD